MSLWIKKGWGQWQWVSFPGYSRCVEFPSGSETGGWMTGRASELQKTFFKIPKGFVMWDRVSLEWFQKDGRLDRTEYLLCVCCSVGGELHQHQLAAAAAVVSYHRLTQVTTQRSRRRSLSAMYQSMSSTYCTSYLLTIFGFLLTEIWLTWFIASSGLWR